MTINGDFERFQYSNFEKSFIKKLKLFLKHWRTVLQLKKLPCQNPILRQIEWGVQNRPITKNGVLPLTTLFF